MKAQGFLIFLVRFRTDSPRREAWAWDCPGSAGSWTHLRLLLRLITELRSRLRNGQLREGIEWAVAAQTLAGQAESGDQHWVKVSTGQALVAVMDGVGHGNEAAQAWLGLWPP